MTNVNSASEPLPEILPVFPLTGVLVFPGMVLPLHIFESRYRNMVADALRAEAVFGMIQPLVPQQDNRPLPGAENERPQLYSVGCAGSIENWEQLADGRYVLELRGISRFRFQEELPLLRGYRRVRADYGAFIDEAADSDWRCNRPSLMRALDEYGKRHGALLQERELADLSDWELVNILGMSLPFDPAEKQALLETRTLQERERVLLGLLRIGARGSDPEKTRHTRTVH